MDQSGGAPRRSTVPLAEIATFYGAFAAATKPLSVPKRRDALREVQNYLVKDDAGDAASISQEDLRDLVNTFIVQATGPRRQRMAEALDRFCKVAQQEIEDEELCNGIRSSANDVLGTERPAGAQSVDPEAEETDFVSLLESLLNADELPPLKTMTALINACIYVLRHEPNILEVEAPCVIVGDIHGQLRDLRMSILSKGGRFGETTYLFLGDYVDRGEASLHCMAILMAAKVIYPAKVFLIRGNHEGRQINGIYGFLNECNQKYRIDSCSDAPQPDHPLWILMNELFDALPLCALVGDKIFCTHGGLSPQADHLDAIVAINRFVDIESGPLADLTWSDPATSDGFRFNSRGCGHLFGVDVSKAFLEANDLAFICRAHQCVKEGYKWTHDDTVLTLFSAPNYCGQGNDGAIMEVNGDLTYRFVTFKRIDVSGGQGPDKAIPEFF